MDIFQSAVVPLPIVIIRVIAVYADIKVEEDLDYQDQIYLPQQQVFDGEEEAHQQHIELFRSGRQDIIEADLESVLELVEEQQEREEFVSPFEHRHSAEYQDESDPDCWLCQDIYRYETSVGF